LEAARELKAKDKGDWLYELCSVAVSSSSTKEYFKALQEHYRNMSINSIPEYRPKPRGPESAIPWDVASKIMWDAMKQKKRLDRGKRQ